MKLICGLGNPGRDYQDHRHNIGFRIVEELARRLGLGLTQRKFNARLAEAQVAGQRVVLMQSTTFMNLSGESVASAAFFFRISPEDTLVVHDELDLPLGRIQLKVGGGSGGHNGLKSIVERWGTAEFARLRFGIGRPAEGASQEQVAGYVLSNFDKQEREQIPELVEKAAAACEAWVEKGVAAAMNQFNRR